MTVTPAAAIVPVAKEAAQPTIIMNKYRVLSKKGEGTFSEVLKVEHVHTRMQYAIKCMKSLYPSIKQVNDLREIQALRRLNPHPNIVGMEEILYDPDTGRLAIVLELMHHNIYEMIRHRKDPLPAALIQSLMYQLLTATCHMHDHGVFHRDIKPENILIKDQSALKVADLGSCRGLFSQPPYTEYISTRWYRAPECLLTSGYYDYKMDMWGIGCVFFELVSLQPLFPGNNELDQIDKIHHILGTPPKAVLQTLQSRGGGGGGVAGLKFQDKRGTGYSHLLPKAVASDDMVDLIDRLLIYNPEKRITARQALQHPYFNDCRAADRTRKPPPQPVDLPPASHPTPAPAPSPPAVQPPDEVYEPDDDHTDGEYDAGGGAAHPQGLDGLGGKAGEGKEGKKKKRKGKAPLPLPPPPPADRRGADVVPLPALGPHHLSPKAKVTTLSTSPARDIPSYLAALTALPPSHPHPHPPHPHPAAHHGAGGGLLVPLSVAAELHGVSYPHIRHPPHPPPAPHPPPGPLSPHSLGVGVGGKRKKKKRAAAHALGSGEGKTHSYGVGGAGGLGQGVGVTGSGVGMGALWGAGGPAAYHHAYSIVGGDMKGWQGGGTGGAQGKAKVAAKPSPFLTKLAGSGGAVKPTPTKWQ